ncbi:MAG: VWA domain-containing protein [Termitinemataceae bacterium]|nr:MAG: VWA domain-containing protein [Termitinemataceae bacterium]
MSDGIYDNIRGITRRQMVMFFLIDTSGSMEGTKIASVNTAIREVIPDLRDIGGADIDLKIAVMEFSTGLRWQNPAGPVPVDTFAWSNLAADGVTNLGAALYELSSKLSRNSFLKAPSASVAPVIMLMSDGWPSDEWESALAALKNNNWFKSAVKVALAIGSDADADILGDFTGDPNSVLSVYTPEALRSMIKKVSITSSQIGSRSQPLQGGQIITKQEAFSKEIQNIVQTDPEFNSADTADGW